MYEVQSYQLEVGKAEKPFASLTAELRELGRDYYPNVTYLCERFEFRPEDRDKVDIRTGEYVGCIKTFAEIYSYKLVMQSASSAVGKTAFFGDGEVGNRHLKKLGYYAPGASHANDAMRHMMYYLVFTLKQRIWLEMLK
jgi:hypothetical protein